MYLILLRSPSLFNAEIWPRAATYALEPVRNKKLLQSSRFHGHFYIWSALWKFTFSQNQHAGIIIVEISFQNLAVLIGTICHRKNRYSITVMVLPPPLNPMAVFERDIKYGFSGKSPISGFSLELCHAMAFRASTSVIRRWQQHIKKASSWGDIMRWLCEVCRFCWKQVRFFPRHMFDFLKSQLYDLREPYD